MKYPHNTWVWYGYAGHFIWRSRCAYHLCTRIGPYLISTVGHYLPRGEDRIEAIGSGSEDYFETFVFSCAGELDSGDPDIDFEEQYGIRYSKSLEAEKGHRNICQHIAETGELPF